MSGGAAQMLIGKPTGRYKSKTVIVVGRRPRSKWWKVCCFGPKGHYRPDGSCAHTDEVLAHVKPEMLARVRVDGFGGEREGRDG